MEPENVMNTRGAGPTWKGKSKIVDRMDFIQTYIPQQSQFQAMPLSVHEYSTQAQNALKPASQLYSSMQAREHISAPKKTGYFPGGREIFKSEPGGGILRGTSPGKGEVILDRFTDYQGRPLCREVAVRARTMDIYKKQLESERNYLLRKLKPGEPMLPVRERIREIDHKLRLHGDLSASWASTNTPRLLFEKFGMDEAKKIGVPVVGNLRVHRVEFEDGTFSSINRSAAISDFAHAETNLSEIRDYLALSNPTTRLTPENINYFKNYYNRDLSKPAKPDKRGMTESYDYGPLRQSMENNIYRAYGTTDINQLRSIEAQRRDNLRRQALQDLYMHFQSRPADNANIVYGRVALLDTTKQMETDLTGYCLSEKNQIMDMKAIYDELDGASVVFDLAESDGPFFDFEGRIHMPKDCCTEEYQGSQVRLNTLLFNVAVQGNTQNATLQYWLNAHAMSKLGGMGLKGEQKKHYDALLKKLRLSSYTDFATAHKAIRLVRDMGYCSVDCYGGKDRTGYALALETFHSIRKKLKEKVRHEGIPIKLDVTLSNIGRQLVSNTSVAVQIVEDNTGFRVLKLTPMDLQLYMSGEGVNWMMGVGARLTDFLKASTLLIAGKGTPDAARQKKILYENADDVEKTREAA